MSEAFKREESIFQEAVELTDAGQRRRFLDEACAGDPAIRADVEALLAAHEIATRFFDEGGRSLKGSLRTSGIEPDAGHNISFTIAAEELPGARIGHYKLLENIGEGGCGTVYLAEQFEPVRRRVALKMIKLGMDTKNVIARFEAERQALALMDHPNIARVFDAGATGNGRPYFVMELVRGVKITEYCDHNRLDARQRLELFVQVCHAIQHAHQKGIIHRDIKPSNVLVTLHDGVPVPKVIDFGIAKATGEQLTEKTFFTSHGHLIGSPSYMSPEQAEMSGLDVDTRSDIYSLGVLLYELLTGKTPFDGPQLLQSGLDEMRRALREDEPRRPSTMVTTLDGQELKITAARRDAEGPKLISLLRGDLDWIVMRALEKDRRRRYETANGLALDIQRYLNNEPVLARPPSRLYRLQKLVHRNKAVFASGFAVAAALVIGLGSATWSFLKEKEARQRAEIREEITQAAFAVTQERQADADRIMLGISNVPPSLESALAFRSLGEWHALNGRWIQASQRFLTLLQMDQFASREVATLDMVKCGSALAETESQKDYETFRELSVARFATKSDLIATERLIKATLLLPATPAFCEKLEPFAEAAMSKTSVPNPAAIIEQSVYPQHANFVVISACSFDGSSVGVSFNQTLDPVSATDKANYHIPGTSVTNVILAADGKSVALQLAAGLNGDFKVVINRLKDNAQNMIAPETTVTNTVLNLQFLAVGDARNASNSIVYRGNVAIVTAGGSDMWYGGDHFVYQYLKVTNDFDYCLRVQAVADTDGTGFARSGLMARDSLEDINGHMVMVERNSGTVRVNASQGTFQVTLRAFADQPTLTESQPLGSLAPAGGLNSWVRLRRAGTRFACYSSTDEVDWDLLYEFDGASAGDGAFTNSVLYLGIATSAHSRITNTTAVVSDLVTTPYQPVKIIVQPAPNLEWRSGSASSLRVVASGSLISYQWRKNGVDIPGATNANYNLAAVNPSDAGAYSALIYNDISSLVTVEATVSVRVDTDPPVVNEVVSYDGVSVGVLYNKPVDPDTATNIANYNISGTTVTKATLMTDGKSVMLRLKDRISGKFSVVVINVTGLAPNTISAESKTVGSVWNLQTLPVGDAANQQFSVAYGGDAAAIVAGGSDIGEKGDHLLFQYLMVTNDFDFRLRVQSVQGGGGVFARTGLMARDYANDSLCHQVMIAVNAGNTFQVMARTKSGSIQTQSQPPNPLPSAYGSNSWVRLQRVGTTFFTYCSDDGESWTKLYQFDSAADEDGPFANTLCLGIATSAWSNRKTVAAVVSDLGVPQNMPADMMISLALLEYRRGNYVKGMGWAQRCLTSPDYQAARVATAHVILAMCCEHLRLFEEARSEMTKARRMVESSAVDQPDSGSPTQGFWFDWVSARVLLREASASPVDSDGTVSSQ